MGSLTWHGWQTSLEDVFGATGILYGGNLRQRPKDDEQKGTNVSHHTDQPVSSRIKSKKNKEGYLGHYDREGAEDGWHFLTGEQENITTLVRYCYTDTHSFYVSPRLLLFPSFFVLTNSLSI